MVNKEVCSICKKLKRVGTRENNRPICLYCLSLKKKETCSICKKLKRVGIRENNKPICSNCNAKRNKKECFICKKLSVVASNEFGSPICPACLSKKKKELCSICGKVSIVVRRVNKKPICGNCNRKNNIKTCSNCGKKRQGSHHNNKYYCSACRVKLFAKKEVCTDCNKLFPVAYRTSDNKPLCGNCRRKQIIEKCSVCGEIKRVHTRKNGVLCSTCYSRTKIEYRFKQYKNRAIKKGLEFEIDFTQFTNIISNPCFYCGETKFIRGVDRKNSKKGYNIENCVSSCWKCNKMKGTMDFIDFIEQIERIFNKVKHEEISRD